MWRYLGSLFTIVQLIKDINCKQSHDNQKSSKGYKPVKDRWAGQLSTSVFRQQQERWWWRGLPDRQWWRLQQQRVPLLGGIFSVIDNSGLRIYDSCNWGFSGTCGCACEHEVARTQGEFVGDKWEKVCHREDHIPEELDFDDPEKHWRHVLAHLVFPCWRFSPLTEHQIWGENIWGSKTNTFYSLMSAHVKPNMFGLTSRLSGFSTEWREADRNLLTW